LFTDPLYMVKREAQRLDFLENRLSMIAVTCLKSNSDRLGRLSSLVASLNPENVLSRGYSITLKSDGRSLIRSSAEVKIGEEIRTRFASGSARSNISGLNGGGDKI
jgi:exodeoxyribonuclease VII large subunit